MLITVLWEDQRALTGNFAPDELLVKCVAERVGRPERDIKNLIVSKPLKGNGKIKTELQKNLKLTSKRGPVFAVIDRDQAVEILLKPNRQKDCMTEIRSRLQEEAPGSYELVFLHDNMETLIEACCQALKLPPPPLKPDPNERDAIIRSVVSAGTEVRKAVLTACPSFARLVEKVAAVVGY